MSRFWQGLDIVIVFISMFKILHLIQSENISLRILQLLYYPEGVNKLKRVSSFQGNTP